ncbi:hypothetical protein BDY21DRAFT_373311 [Lineolata rhizophorae]|uniref:Uncharacterized protein n=1 Tax=Lineolata rhizophorae TaxID=578093 RepID=A0A6A6NVF2_9PEZI|nr:hypothetical protein BDY21DRAFT_373311 [Lineolata rhizophorae]
MTTSSQPCHFLRIPPELRLYIFYLVLQSQADTETTEMWPPASIPITCNPRNNNYLKTSLPHHWPSIFRYWGSPRMAAALRLNRQLHREATDVLYTRFTLFFAFNMNLTAAEFSSWLAARGPAAARLIRRVCIPVMLDTIEVPEPPPEADASAVAGWASALARHSHELATTVRVALPALRFVALDVGIIGDAFEVSQIQGDEGSAARAAHAVPLVDVLVKLGHVFEGVAKVVFVLSDWTGSPRYQDLIGRAAAIGGWDCMTVNTSSREKVGESRWWIVNKAEGGERGSADRWLG